MHEPGTDVHARAWFVAVLIVVIKAGVVVTVMDRDRQFLWVTCRFGEFPRLLPVTQVNVFIFPGGEMLIIITSC